MNHDLYDTVEVISGPHRGAIGRVVNRVSSSGPNGVLERYGIDCLGHRIDGLDDSELRAYKATRSPSSETMAVISEYVKPTWSPSDCRCIPRDLLRHGCKCGAFKASKD